MSEQQQERRETECPARPPQLASIADSYEAMAQLLEENAEMKVNAQALERQLQLTERRADLAEAENERLRRQVHQMKGEVNHHFRSTVEADNSLAAIAAIIVDRQRVKDEAADRAQRRRQGTHPRQDRADDPTDLPNFLRAGPRSNEETEVRTPFSLRKAVGGGR
jgi:hypothetical protein